MSTIPLSFYCSITLEIMNDPVCDKDGNSYERSAILDWIRSHGCSPINRTPLSATDLVPNEALKVLIMEHFKMPLKQPRRTDATVTKTDQKLESKNIELRAFVDSDSKMLITIDPGSSQTRTHLNVSCVIDISSCMETIASVGELQPSELTILDIAKHAVTTVIKSLNSNDRLAIVTFSDSAYTVLQLMAMDDKGQDMAVKTLKCIHSYASCNLWAGLEKGLDLLNRIDENDETDRISTVMLFTAGKPNINPPQEHLQMLKMYKNRLGCLPGSVNTFGFGHFLDSKLLYSLAKEGHGSYHFIPDGSFVGTSMVHAIANLKVTITQSCRLSIEPLNGATFVNTTTDLGEYLSTETTRGLTVDIGSIQTGQTKDILLQMNNLPEPGTTYASISLNVITQKNNSITVSAKCDAIASNDRILPTYFRYKFIDVIEKAIKLMADRDDSVTVENVLGMYRTLIKEIEDAPPQKDSLAILKDLKVQVQEALKPDYLQNWERHHLLTLVCAHNNQVCNNFKDIGPQVYGGSLFKTLRDEAETILRSLPPPKPSDRVVRAMPVTYQEVPQWRNFINRLFNNSGKMSGGVCFHGNGLVRMFGGGTKTVETISKGDRIETMNGATTTVICVVESEIAENVTELVECQSDDGSSLLITPWHPIRMNESEKWIFPISIGQPRTISCSSVFNFVLDKLHIINVDHIDCVTLGHSFDDPVCAHEYFGTQRVIDDLQAMGGYSSGFVRLVGVQRDPLLGEVNGLIEG